MSNEPLDPRWPKLLSLAVHEFRTPITVAAGYLRMVLKERAGPITDQQRKLLEEAEKSCGRLSALVAELSDLSALEDGRAGFNPATVDLRGLIHEQVAALPEMPDREIAVAVEGHDGRIDIQGDAARLRTAFTSLIVALRREVINADRMIVRLDAPAAQRCVVAIGTPEQVAGFAQADPSTLAPFDEWRGGSGLSLAIARRVIGRHGGVLLTPPGGEKAGAVVTLPCA
jgi:signal transduction histidine kinase